MNIMKLRPLFLLISTFLIIGSLISIIRFGFNQSIDFSGGTVWEMISQSPDLTKIKDIFSSEQAAISSISNSSQNGLIIKSSELSPDQKLKIESKLKSTFSDYQELRYESLGPVLGRELLIKTVTGIVLSSLALLLFIGSRFKDMSFGAAAVLAMLHDAFILIGSFSLFGKLFGAELDALFVTALLTILSSSVHDTVVTFDRIRELKRTSSSLSWVELANRAVTETIVRSLNNSMTIILMLLALVLLGGQSTRWFATALLVGVISGTYSSTGVAIPLVLLFKRQKKS